MELAVAGYGGLSIEAVAVRAGVNRTTVHRRRPAKPDLVRAALLSINAERPPPPDAGTTRGYVAQRIHEHRGSFVGRLRGDVNPSSSAVQAPARVEQVIAKVRALAGDEGIEPDLVEALYRQMIARFVSIELAAHRDHESTP